jgi:hypothetical protein
MNMPAICTTGIIQTGNINLKKRIHFFTCFLSSLIVIYFAYFSTDFWLYLFILQAGVSVAALNFTTKMWTGALASYFGLVIGYILCMNIDKQSHNLWPIELVIMLLFFLLVFLPALISKLLRQGNG